MSPYIMIITLIKKVKKFAERCEFSNTTLSAYENGRKIPSLNTIACIAKQLNVNIERLYYGDESIAFIKSEPDEGMKIVNSIYLLWDLGVICYYENFRKEDDGCIGGMLKNIQGTFLRINKYSVPIKRFLNSLEEFKRNEETYFEPDKYLNMLKASVAKEINNLIQRDIDERKKAYEHNRKLEGLLKREKKLAV